MPRPHRPPLRASSGGQTQARAASRFGISGCATVVAVLAAIAAACHRAFPSEQRCPPTEDRFYDHCREGRKHYMINIDWACLGPERSTVMRQALGLEGEAQAQHGGRVPSWLTSAHADVVRVSPCVQDVRVDLACWHCKPTPRTALQQAADAETADAQERRAAAASPEPRESDAPADRRGGGGR